MLALDEARAALVFSLVSVVFTLCGLIWEIANFILNGARLKVELTPVVVTAQGHLIEPGRPKSLGEALPHESTINSDVTADLAKFQVTNLGRSPVTVSSIEFDFSRPFARQRRRWKLGMRSVPLHGSVSDAASYRLEPYDSITKLTELWPVVTYARREGKKQKRRRVTIRASIKPAGRRARRSTWRTRIRVERTASRVWVAGNSDLKNQLFQEVVGVVGTTEPSRLYDAWIAVLSACSHDDGSLREPSHAALAAALESFANPLQAMLIAARLKGLWHRSTDPSNA